MPAVIFASGEAAGLHIAALTVLDRLIVAIHRAGAGPISIVSDDALPALKRARALGVEFREGLLNLNGPTLVATANCMAQPGDIRRCIDSGSRLLANDGTPLSIGVVPSIGESPQAALARLPGIAATGRARAITDRASAKTAERALWSSLASPGDGLIDKVFNRPCGRPLSKVLIHTPVTPNMVSLISILLGVISACFFAVGTQGAILLGASLFQLSAIVDCVDGELARVMFKESPLGKWIDLVGDQLVYVSVFAGIAFGVTKVSGAPEVPWLGGSAVVGALLSFAVILRGMRAPGGPDTMLKRLIGAATNRDFSVLVLILAVFEKLHLFLWMAAVGSHVFWVAALSLQVFSKARERAKVRTPAETCRME